MKPKKSLGQNFLISTRVSNAIAGAGNIKEGEIVLEIGPGKGALTKELLAAGAHVIAIEKDESLVAILQEKFGKEISEKRLEIIPGDVLSSAYQLPTTSYKLIANIPYYITGAIIEKFCSSENPPTCAVLMVQKEVAERILARDGKESILSISVKIFGTPSIVMRVSRGNFFPIPNVDSAVLKIENIKNPFSSKKEEEKFFDIVKKGFAHKRKKLTSNLGLSAEEIEMFGIPKNARAEDMPLAFWKNLAEKII
jgi:16S rRNA (adenine1518-N6/adenine1519-N6)-dimethyltransferase